MEYLISILLTISLILFYLAIPMLVFGKGKSKTYIQEHRMTFIIYAVLRLLVTFTMIRSFYQQNYYNAFLCFAVLVMFMIPMILERQWKIELPTTLEVIILLFIFNAEILGEIESFYTKYPYWDTILHTLNGFLCAGIGFSLFDMLNRQGYKSIHLAPSYLAITAFCFSMTVGVMWEFGERAVDHFLLFDAQKDSLVTAFSSVNLNESGLNEPVKVTDITKTIIQTTNGEIIIEGGYLDIGINDTMKDLFVNFIGAVVFCSLGYVYLIKQDEVKGDFIRRFLIKVIDE